MQKFTRPIVREIDLGGERLAVTFGEKGIEVRPVGSRKPPREMTWQTFLCHLTGQCAPGPSEPTPEQVAAAVQELRKAPPASTAPDAEVSEPAVASPAVAGNPPPVQ